MAITANGQTSLTRYDVFAAIGDPTRRKVLDLLSRENLAAGEIASHFTISRPAISQHLLVLRRARLVDVRRRGRQQVYRLNAEPLQQVQDWLGHYSLFWNEKLSALGDYLDQASGERM